MVKGPVDKAVDVSRAKVMSNLELVAKHYGLKSPIGERDKRTWIDISSTEEIENNLWKPKKVEFEDNDFPMDGDTVYLFNDSYICNSKFKIRETNQGSEYLTVKIEEEEFIPEVSLDEFIQDEELDESLKEHLMKKIFPISESINASANNQKQVINKEQLAIDMEEK